MIWHVWLESVLSYVPCGFCCIDERRVLRIMRVWLGGRHYHSIDSRVAAALFGAPQGVLHPIWRNIARRCRVALKQIGDYATQLRSLHDAMHVGTTLGGVSVDTAQSIVNQSIVYHLDCAIRQFQRQSGISPHDVLQDFRLHEGFRAFRRGDANFEHFGFLAVVVDCAPLRLYVDGHQALNRATFGRADGGWAVIPVLDGIVQGRLWGRTLGLGEPNGLCLHASNNTSELYAVGAALCCLAHAELTFGVRLGTTQRARLRLIGFPSCDLSRSCWVRWYERRATILYDSRYGIGIAMGRTPLKVELALGF